MILQEDRQAVLDAIELADLCGPAEVADVALGILEHDGLTAALAEIRRAAEYDAAGGNKHMV